MGTIALTYNGGLTLVTVHNDDIPKGGTHIPNGGTTIYNIVINIRISSEVTVTTTLALLYLMCFEKIASPITLQRSKSISITFGNVHVLEHQTCYYDLFSPAISLYDLGNSYFYESPHPVLENFDKKNTTPCKIKVPIYFHK